ncbi:hypothetical protein QJS10_CPB04g00876 [Acorus calamus]|uniref:FLZ-type domain-containing protein n=1 Tax=Acorus calamus TaxID=4465 RepID=A0AAV9F0Y7_ACOCL|nr:hypothetical protein QJS10_CPB04g00876 [Acorus calamus]
MAGLSLVLETQNVRLNKGPQIISKATVFKAASASSPPPSPSPCIGGFLDSCFLCKKRLPLGKDIYMYRCKQIFMDEESLQRENCSFAAMKPVSSSSSASTTSHPPSTETVKEQRECERSERAAEKSVREGRQRECVKAEDTTEE